jgi:hypothetical protein
MTSTASLQEDYRMSDTTARNEEDDRLDVQDVQQEQENHADGEEGDVSRMASRQTPASTYTIKGRDRGNEEASRRHGG